MIMEKQITKKQAQKLVEMLEQWTRCDIIARHKDFGNTLGHADYYHDKLKLEDKIRTRLFGSCNLVELGHKWGILKETNTKGKKRI
jgi:hypothetical protein